MKSQALRIKIILFFLIFLTSDICFARTISSLPHSIDVSDDSDFTDGSHVTYSYLATGGWDGGDAAKIQLVDNVGEDDAGWTGFDIPDGNTRINIRWVVYFGTNYTEATTNNDSAGKMLLLRRTTGEAGDRGLVVHTNSSGMDWYSVCNNTQCCTAPSCADANSLTYDDQVAGFTLFRIDQHEGEWICFEAEFDLTNGYKLWITTRDGSYSAVEGAPYYSNPNLTSNAGSWANLQFYGYWEAISGADSNSYMLVSSIDIATSYIGIPSGFLNTTQTISGGVTLSGSAQLH